MAAAADVADEIMYHRRAGVHAEPCPREARVLRGGVQPPKSAQPLQTTDRRLVKVIGGTSYTDYSLDEPWELVPGKWTMQLWQGSRKLAEKSFTVTAK